VPEAEERPGEEAADDAVVDDRTKGAEGELTAGEPDEENEDPLAPLGVGVGTAMAVAFGVWWLVRRNEW
jgi:hypothetical protein